MWGFRKLVTRTGDGPLFRKHRVSATTGLGRNRSILGSGKTSQVKSAKSCEQTLSHKMPLASLYFFAILEYMAKRSYLGEFELMILLALIRVGDDAYGVPIAKELLNTTGREVALGSVYAALDRLEEKDLVSSTLGDPTPERGGRAKRYFRITKKGMREVQAARTALTNLWRGLPRLEEEPA